jgi:DNA-binding beta-propeller fold protein YncE
LNNQFSTPYGIARDESTGTLYIVDSNNYRVMSYASGATSGIQVAGGTGAGFNNTQLNTPFGLYFDSLSNSLIISNINGHNVVRWVLGATSWTLMAGSINGSTGSTSTLLSSPTDVTFDPMGNMYVADNGNHRIQLIMAGQSDGITIAGIPGVSGSNLTMLNAPYSVELDNQLNLYVSDALNQRIQKFVRY